MSKKTIIVSQKNVSQLRIFPAVSNSPKMWTPQSSWKVWNISSQKIRRTFRINNRPKPKVLEPSLGAHLQKSKLFNLTCKASKRRHLSRPVGTRLKIVMMMRLKYLVDPSTMKNRVKAQTKIVQLQLILTCLQLKSYQTLIQGWSNFIVIQKHQVIEAQFPSRLSLGPPKATSAMTMKNRRCHSRPPYLLQRQTWKKDASEPQTRKPF